MFTPEVMEALNKIAKAVPQALNLTPEQAAALREYNEVQNLPWNDAVENCRFMMGEAIALGPTGFFYVMGCQDMLRRYENGERSRELFDDMINAH